jgi:opacity protein-like surface antigen
MLKNFFAVASFVGLLSYASLGYSQALPTATSHGAAQLGFGWSWAKPDYGEKTIQGITAFGDFDFTPHIGAEAEYHYLSLETPNDLGENSFLVGPRYVLTRGKYSLYAKALIGVGDIVIQEVSEYPQSPAGNYTAFAGGGGVDYRATRHIVVRGDFEYQHWNYRNGLTPTVFTVAAAYRFR